MVHQLQENILTKIRKKLSKKPARPMTKKESIIDRVEVKVIIDLQALEKVIEEMKVEPFASSLPSKINWKPIFIEKLGYTPAAEKLHIPHIEAVFKIFKKHVILSGKTWAEIGKHWEDNDEWYRKCKEDLIYYHFNEFSKQKDSDSSK